MRTQQQDQAEGKLQILERLSLVIQSTENWPSLLLASEKNAIISTPEKESILKQFGTKEDQLSAFYLLLNSKQCPVTKLLSLFNSTGNESVANVLENDLDEKDNDSIGLAEREEWKHLKKLIADNIDRLSSHTMNLGLVLCFASGIGLISAKDREIIANYSSLEIDQLKKFYSTVSKKGADAHEKVLKVLKMTNNNWALDVLQIKETD